MKKQVYFLIFAFAMVLSLVPGCAGKPPVTPELKVVCGTTLISTIVREIGGGKIDAASVIPPLENPTDFTVRPENITALATADILIIHSWQVDKFTDAVIGQANNPKLRVAKVSLAGDWMIPEVQLQATDKVLEALKSLDGKNSALYDAGADAYKAKVQKKASQVLEGLKNQKFYPVIGTINVMCAASQADFLRWVGVNVFATYGRPGTMTPARVQELYDAGKDKQIALLVETYQNGDMAGEALANRLHVDRVVLSGYPGAAKYTTNWEDTFARNMTLIIATISACPYC